MISYAQNFEDVMLWRALKHIEKGFYIDVGANDPNRDSVTRAFYEHGWRGINIEPVPQWFEKLQSQRPRDINLQVAAGAQQGELLLYDFPDTGLSTFDKKIVEMHEAEGGYKKVERNVHVESLTTLCRKYHVAPIHFLKIDVEGTEKQVLEGLDLSEIRPWVILLESTLPNTQIEDFKSWEPILLGQNYKYAYFDGLNRFYVAKEHRELRESFKVPPNCFDSFTLSGIASNSLCSRVVEQREQAKAALAEQKVHTQGLQNEWNVAKAQLEELAAELAVSNANTVHLDARFSEKSEALIASQAELDREQTRSQCLQNEWDTVKTRLEELAGELAVERAHREQLTAELSEKNEALASSQAALDRERAHSQSLQNQWDTAKVKIDELNSSSHHWWTIADRLGHELQGVYNSKAWRITWPVRTFMHFFRWLLVLPISITRWFLRLPKRVARWVVAKAIALALKHPGLKVRVKALLCKYPNLESRLRRLAEARGLVAAQQASPTALTQQTPEFHQQVRELAGNGLATSKVDLSHLTPSARRIYSELKSANARYQKEMD